MPIEEFSFSWSRYVRGLMIVPLAGPRHSTIQVAGDQVKVKMGVGGWTFASDVPPDGFIRSVSPQAE